jgi:acyl dehydratase
MVNLQAWDKYFEGMTTSWEFSFSASEMRTFSKLSGDYNPVHCDSNFAKSKGFDSPIVYGLLLSSQMSRLIGQELPDQNAILTGVQIDFMKPSFPGQKLMFDANLVMKSNATHALDFKCQISRDNETLCRGTVKAVWLP